MKNINKASQGAAEAQCSFDKRQSQQFRRNIAVAVSKMSYFLIAVFFLVFCIGAWLVFATTSSLTQARKPNVVVIDCRSQSEWDSGHVNIGEVLHIPLGELKDSKKLPKDKARPIMITALLEQDQQEVRLYWNLWVIPTLPIQLT